MKKFKFILILLLFLGAIYFLITLIPGAPSDKNDLKVLLIYNKIQSDKNDYIKEAYKSVLEEEGVSFEFKESTFPLSYDPQSLVKHYPAIIFADGIAQSLPPDLGPWIREYLVHGGHVAIVFDAGTKDMRNNYRDKAIFNQLLGLDYILYSRLLDPNQAYTSGYVRFKDHQSEDFFQVTPGKTDDKLYINGYSYGQLTFPFARVMEEKSFDKKDIYAFGVTDANEEYPLLVVKKVFQGHMLYANLPLGHIKAYSDDFFIRSVLRTFLFEVAKIPQLVNTPGGEGGLVINWHIDWNQDWGGLSYMLQNGFFSPYIQYSIHNTAGDFTDKPGDGLGFDACGKGKEYLQKVLPYGILGSHGGWAHNWFYKNILNGYFGEKEMEQYIVKNNRCLESISGYPVSEYSAPNGVHPQPAMTRILEKLGIIAYYYTGDSGSAPNRTFYEKKMVSQNVIAFPLTPKQECASFYEMFKDGDNGEEIHAWLSKLLRFVEEKRVIRLIYSHSYDVPPYYHETLKQVIKEVEEHAAQGKANVKSMTYFSFFLQRFLKNQHRFIIKPQGMEVHLNNPQGLQGMVVAIPRDKYKEPHPTGTELEMDNLYYYLKITERVNDKIFQVDTNNR